MGSHYLVRCDDGVDRICMAKGNLRLKGIRTTNPVAVGDRVDVELRDDPSASEQLYSYITRIHQRKNYIIRRSSNLSKEAHILASNLDATWLLCTMSQPYTSSVFIDRFLATAEAYSVPATLLFNKIDLYTPSELETMQDLMALYESIGYPCLAISAVTGEGLDRLRALLDDRIILLSGHSGVGKSTLLNALEPGLDLRTAAISDVHRTGMHTTTFSQMISVQDLHSKGWLIDTPGVKGFGTIDMEQAEVSHYFPDIFACSSDCRFSNCLHLEEPNCAVVQAVESGQIALSRYESYLSILSDKDADKYRPEY